MRQFIKNKSEENIVIPSENITINSTGKLNSISEATKNLMYKSVTNPSDSTDKLRFAIGKERFDKVKKVLDKSKIKIEDLICKIGVDSLITVVISLNENSYNILNHYFEDSPNVQAVIKTLNNKPELYWKNIASLICKAKLANIPYELFKPTLQKYLQTAVLIEHSTIPPYLTAMYSIHDGKNKIANQIIRSVVVEEMLHMIMVCNAMNALDLKPRVNKRENYPVYPSKLPLNVDFFVNLEKFSHNAVSSFIAIEQPDQMFVEAPITESKETEDKNSLMMLLDEPSEIDKSKFVEDFSIIIEKYTQGLKTIGEYYTFLKNMIVLLNHLYPDELFNNINEEFQISSEEYYGSGGNLIIVKNIDGIKEVFQEIMDQGEGASVDNEMTMYDKDISQFGEGYELSHYYRFKEILHEHYYVGGDYEAFKIEGSNVIPITTPPNGKALDIDWKAVYPIKMNAKMTDYKDHPQILEQAKEFNKTYKRLMDSIQAAITGEKEELSKSIMYMHALREQAVGLMKQPLNKNENAAPTFEYINL